MQVHVKRSVLGREDDFSTENENRSHSVGNFKPPILRKGKLVVIDLAGSERVHKSGAYNTLNLLLLEIICIFCPFIR